MSTNAKLTKTSRRSSKARTRRAAIDHPFDPAVLARAERLVDEYTIVMSRDGNGAYLGEWLEFPGVLGVGDNFGQCHREARALLLTTIAYLIEKGEPLPAPTREERRGEQVNIRLSKLEKLRLEALASQQGFRSISDYVRAAALSRPA